MLSVRLTLYPASSFSPEKIWKDCFKLYDDDGSGEITYVELQLTRGGRTDAVKGITQVRVGIRVRVTELGSFRSQSVYSIG